MAARHGLLATGHQADFSAHLRVKTCHSLLNSLASTVLSRRMSPNFGLTHANLIAASSKGMSFRVLVM